MVTLGPRMWRLQACPRRLQAAESHAWISSDLVAPYPIEGTSKLLQGASNAWSKVPSASSETPPAPLDSWLRLAPEAPPSLMEALRTLVSFGLTDLADELATKRSWRHLRRSWRASKFLFSTIWKTHLARRMAWEGSRRARCAGNWPTANAMSEANRWYSRFGRPNLGIVLTGMLGRRKYLPGRRKVLASVSFNRQFLKVLGGFPRLLRLCNEAHEHATSYSPTPLLATFRVVLESRAFLDLCPREFPIFEKLFQSYNEAHKLSWQVSSKVKKRERERERLVLISELILNSLVTKCLQSIRGLVTRLVAPLDILLVNKITSTVRPKRHTRCALGRAARTSSSSLSGASSPPTSSPASPPCTPSSPPTWASTTWKPLRTDALLEKLVMYHHSTEEEGAQPLLPKTYKPDTRMYTTLMKGYMKEGRVEDVVRMIRAMQQEEDPASHPDHVTYTTVITTLIKAGEMDRARSVLAEMARAGVPANLVTYNVLLKGYCQQLQLDKAKDLIREIPKQAGIGPNVVSYNILIDGCILIDDSAGALAYFNEMRAQGIAPSKVSYTTLMKAFALSGQPKLAHKVFDEMEKDPRVKLDRVAYNMLTEGYCRLGLLEEGKKIVEKMRQNGFEPDVATYGCLANGIALARKPGEALLLWNEVKERCASLPPLRPDEGLLDALADVCVRAAFFKKALEIVACMEENGISPNKTKYKRIYVEMHSRMFTSKHASQARQDRRKGRKRAAEAFKFWLGLPNSYYGSEWRLEPSIVEDEYGDI
ncbi:hypothetical protein ZIOFF_026313 [Zingiber officinale]|uniref:Pentatricopeptide repeat-containing protein n=1 Tax=Zingiber officinale TaxID=94328 RepID=A0A8J5H4Q6_ZINOF|nr:hypothetical protein ZIOFF_026313 [Zingiber officinale]